MPENMPPIFQSKDIAQSYSEAGRYLVTSKCVGHHAPYDASKRGGTRRLFGIPHPIFIHDQAFFIEKHWESINNILRESTGSHSKPEFSSSGSRSIHITPHSELPKIRLSAFSRFRYCVVTDVSRFYPSVYTHSIPWAINGYEASKADRGANSSDVYGNRLDYILRQSQGQQTLGMAVGPDTSRVIGEIILSAVDKLFLSLSPGSKYVRHVDDYWIGGRSFEECEDKLAKLRTALRYYNVDINESKTRIIEFNRILADPGMLDVERAMKKALVGNSSSSDLVATFGQIIEISLNNNDDGIIKHAIRLIDRLKSWTENWDVLEHFLAHCAIQFPHSFDYVARVIAWRFRRGDNLDRRLWRDVIRSVSYQSASLSRDSEVAWSLWLAKELEVKITKKISDLIVKNNSPVILGLLLHMSRHDLVSDKEISDKLLGRLEGSHSRNEFWPLALELRHLDLMDAWEINEVGSAQSKIFEEQRSLLRWDARPSVFDMNEDDEPAYAIEDFAFDYEADDIGFWEDEDDEDF
ncbi:RNA-directed DNA polymerase [Methyloligella halotolerans]|uniref:RNA-directed DNA polymerase n=1 Tax=Methyloligella halotolerans TaxID=1177755 RepID=UPI00114CAD68|nr:RNA-directed DNA polymerase [Methyloligella halotolerans]